MELAERILKNNLRFFNGIAWYYKDRKDYTMILCKRENEYRPIFRFYLAEKIVLVNEQLYLKSDINMLERFFAGFNMQGWTIKFGSDRDRRKRPAEFALRGNYLEKKKNTYIEEDDEEAI